MDVNGVNDDNSEQATTRWVIGGKTSSRRYWKENGKVSGTVCLSRPVAYWSYIAPHQTGNTEISYQVYPHEVVLNDGTKGYFDDVLSARFSIEKEAEIIQKNSEKGAVVLSIANTAGEFKDQILIDINFSTKSFGKFYKLVFSAPIHEEGLAHYFIGGQKRIGVIPNNALETTKTFELNIINYYATG